MKKWLVRILVATIFFSSTSIQNVNAAESIEVRVEQMLSQMTLEQKVGQMLQPDTRSITPQQVKDNYIGSILSGGGASPSTGNTATDWADRLDAYQQAAIEGYGIPLIYGVDAVHGHNNVYGATIFPHNIGLGQANDPELMTRIGAVTAEEMRATGAHWTFTPTLGLPKNERWGRTYECFGEDAELSAALGSAYIEGSQGDLGSESAIATAKHFIGEGITSDGINQGNVPLAYDSAEFQNILETELLIPYQEAIDSGVKSVMVSYSSINGVKCHGNQELITDLLKGELGFQGIVVSDYNGIDQIEGNLSYQQKAIKGVNAGIDMLMVDGYNGATPNWMILKSAIIEGVNTNAITVERIDDAVRRILTVKFELGFMDDASLSYANRELLATVGSEEHRQIAREAVRKSLVLLKNTETNGGQSTLLSDLPNMDKVVVAGSAADDIGMQSGGWTISWQGATGNTTQGTTILQGIKEVAGDGVVVDYSANGYFTETDYQAAVVVVGETPYAEYAGDRAPGDLRLRDVDIQTINQIKTDHPDLPIIAVLTVGRPLTIADQIDDLDAVIMAGFPGSEGAGIGDVLFSDTYDFQGKLTYTWPWYAQDIPEKFVDSTKVMFATGRGLTKAETTPLETEQPIDPTIVDLGATNGVLEAEAFIAKNSEVQLENNGSTVGYFWEGRDITYRVDVPEQGRYTISVDAATQNNNIQVALDILVDGKLFYSTNTALPNTGGWATFQPLTLDGMISLPEGVHDIKVVSRSRDFNLDRYNFTFVDANYEEPDTSVGENIGTGALIQEGIVNVTMSSSENSQNMSWYAGDQEIKNKNQSYPALDLRNADSSDMTTIIVNDDVEYQPILGMGTSIEESTVNNMLKMSPEKRKEFITQLLDPETGMGNTLFRVTIGTADFTGQPFYTYYDGTGTELNGNPDWDNVTGNGFSIQKDRDYGIIQVIKEIQDVASELGLADEIKFFASSWTPPGWMKEPTSASNSYPNNDLLLKGGRLSEDDIDDLAKYYVRYIEEYKKEGIPIYAMTLQNEPLLEIDYPSCYITATQEAKLAEAIKNELANSAILSEEEKDVKVWAFDHNFDGAQSYVNELFATEAGRENIDGIAFHPYGGVPSTMGGLYNTYQDEYTMHLTERSVWGTNGANDIVDWLRNGAQSYNAWVTMLDSKIAPHQWVGTPDPTMFVQDANNRERYWSTPEVYLIGQFTKYVRPGYVRIDTNNGSSSTVSNVAFKDPETGKIVLIVVNRSGVDQNFKTVLDGTQFNATLPAGNVATYVWNPVDATVYKEVTDDLTLADASITGGVVNNDEVGYIDGNTKLEYLVNVSEPGSYKVEVEVAVGSPDWNYNYPIVISQGETELGRAHAMRYNFWDTEWASYFKVQTYVTFTEAGLQSFDVTFPDGGMNFKDIQFTKEEAVQLIPGKLDTDNYFDNRGVVKEESDISNFGFIGADDYIDYQVNVLQSGTYDFVFDIGTSTASLGATIESIDNQGNIIALGNVVFPSTGGTATYQKYTTPIALTQGAQTIRITFTGGDVNCRSLVIGQAISITQDALVEGELSGKTATITLENAVFNATLDEANWELDVPDGVTYTLTRVDDTTVAVTFTGEAINDFDADKVVTCNIDAAEFGGADQTYLSGEIHIEAVDDEEELVVNNPVAFGQATIVVDIVGGTFTDDIISKVTLSDAISKYVSIDSIEQTSPTSITLNVTWDPMYSDVEGTITIANGGYSDGTISLETSTVFTATTEKPDSIPVGDQPVILGEELSYRNNGSLVTTPQRGNYVDFYLDVEEAGEYVIQYKVKTSEAVSNALKISGGAGLATDNLESISFGKFWDNTLGYANSLSLAEGEQTLRFEMNGDGYQIQEIIIKKADAPIFIGSQATTITVDDIVDGSKTKGWGIENKAGINSIGCSEAGAYQDYNIEVEKDGIYSFQMNAGGNSGNQPQAVLQLLSSLTRADTELGRVTIPNTGNWDTFTNTSTIEVRLPAGIHKIRIYDDVDGFNYRSFTFTLLEEIDVTKPVISGTNNVMVYRNATTSLYDILGLSVIDDVDGDITRNTDKVVFETTYDSSVVGQHTVKVIATDAEGNVQEMEFIITIVNVASMTYDATPVLVGTEFDPLQDVNVYDIDGTDITSDVVIVSNNVDTSVAGEYEIVYEVVDSLGTTVRFTRLVTVINEIDIIDDNGDNEQTIPGNPENDIITPSTGDATNSTLYLGMAMLSLVLGYGIYRRKKRML
jgi:beta-glucosidase